LGGADFKRIEIMAKSKKSHGWWWLLVIIVLAGLSYYLYSQMFAKPTKEATVEKTPPAKVQPLSQDNRSPAGEEQVTRVQPIQEESTLISETKEDYCTQIEKDVAEFFLYLDEKGYFRKLNPETDAQTRFKKILRRVSARPPFPAGEGADPKIIVQNLYHFFRILGRKDLMLIRSVINNEQDSLELSLELFYRWLTLGDRCPDPEKIRPSMKILYHYAGFFINTTGGRAYLFRRPSGLRLLVSYYSLLIIHEADRKGTNNYGIDILPFLISLKKEIGYYPDFQLQEKYIDRLVGIERYYGQRR
jgi:hypothetical protein